VIRSRLLATALRLAEPERAWRHPGDAQVRRLQDASISRRQIPTGVLLQFRSGEGFGGFAASGFLPPEGTRWTVMIYHLDLGNR
jgi:hypothetical protein